MTNTKDSAEALALRGLLLLVVEIGNIVQRAATDDSFSNDEAVEQIYDLAESAGTRDLVQLARAALESKAPDGWHMVSDVLPLHRGFYEVAYSDFRPPAVDILEYDAGPLDLVSGGYFRASTNTHGHVTHWRELPAHPAESQAAIPAAQASVHE